MTRLRKVCYGLTNWQNFYCVRNWRLTNFFDKYWQDVFLHGSIKIYTYTHTHAGKDISVGNPVPSSQNYCPLNCQYKKVNTDVTFFKPFQTFFWYYHWVKVKIFAKYFDFLIRNVPYRNVFTRTTELHCYILWLNIDLKREKMFSQSCPVIKYRFNVNSKDQRS